MKTFLRAVAGGATLSAVATSAAHAHVKWFAPFDVSDQPLSVASMEPLILPPIALVLIVFALACYAESTRLGPAFLKLCAAATGGLHARIEDLMRGAAAVFFAALALSGEFILTPELRTDATLVSVVQAAIAIAMFWRSTLPLAAAGIVGLLVYGVVVYGAFHMMDYPVFLGIAAFFALSSCADPQGVPRRLAFARCGLAFSLMWAAVEKWAYPQWTGYILQAHPHLSAGIDPKVLIALAGAVEFGLGFGLLWTPAVRKASAAALAVIMTAAILEFGAVDAMGHLLIIVILVSVVAAREQDASRAHAALGTAGLAAAVKALAVVAVVGGYYGGHRLAFGDGDTHGHGFAAAKRVIEAHAEPATASERR